MYRVDETLLNQQKTDLIHIGQWIDQKGWCPATGGNFSLRIPNLQSQHSLCLLTASGTHKGRLTEDDFVLTDLAGQALDSLSPKQPSAETLVHVALYRLSDEINAVLHIHSLANTVLSLIENGNTLEIKGLEMQKSVAGIASHEESLRLAIFDNTQDMTQLAQEVEQRWKKENSLKGGLLVRGHGAYVWGRDLQEAWRHLEGIEFLLRCMLELKKLSVSSY